MALQDLHPLVLETERLYLSELNPEIVQRLYTSCSDEEIMAYMGLATARDLAAEKNKFRQGISTFHHTFKQFRLIGKESGAVIGRCDYHTWVKAHRRAEIGYHLFEDKYKQKGLMTEALRPILEFGFNAMNLYRVEALVAAYNTPSLKLMKHFGFTQEGNLRGHYLVNGVMEDSLMFSLLRPEYEQLKNSWETKAQQV